MKLKDVATGQITALSLQSADGDSFPEGLKSGIEVRLARGTDALVVQIGDVDRLVRGVTADDDAKAERLLSRRLPCLAWLVSTSPKKGPVKHIGIQVHEFPLGLRWEEAMDVAVDEKIVDDVSRRRGALLSVDEACAWLSERMVIEEPARVLLTAGRKPKPQVTAFRVHGRSVAVDIATGDDGKLRVQRVVEARAPKGMDDQRPVVLAEVDLRFVDATVAGAFRGVARTTLDQLVSQADSYLGLWRDYNRLEREAIIGKARRLGAWRYTARKSVGEGWRFELKEPGAFRSAMPEGGIELEVAGDRPAWLLDPDPDKVEQPRRRERNVTGKLLGVHGAFATVRVPEDDEGRPPAEGWLFMSLHGDLTRLARREEAWSMVAAADNPMPQLGLLLMGAEVPIGRRSGIEPLSPAARACFRGEPTPRQIEALRVALNTPDIAIIQGPPGTGKTEVIAALKVRLAEVAEEREGIGGLFLVTSFQHEAVENAAARIRVMGLPAVKVGGRRDAPDVHDDFDRWVAEHAEKVRAQLAAHPGGPAHVALQSARRRISVWLAAPSRRETPDSVARWVIEQLCGFLPPTLLDRASDLAHGVRAYQASEDIDRELALQAARRIRIDRPTWSDDGPQMAHRARIRLQGQGLLTDREAGLLDRAARWEGGEPPFLEELKALQEGLVDRLLPRPTEAGPAHADADVEHFLRAVLSAVHERVRQTADGTTIALEELHHALEHDREGVRDAVAHYTTVLAATVGQVVGAEMRDMKSESITFDTVVVDEAARANPLDLLIALARAERRIVKVGDHRQLAHMLEPDIEGVLNGTVEEATREALRQSLFERLFLALRDRADVKRVVTLDKQFRMHPVLGEFVSDVFYAPYGEGFASPRPASDFVHEVARWTGCVAGWLDVPYLDGAERPEQSKSRPVEADCVAEEVRAILSDPGAADLTVGVITFYSAQVDELMASLAAQGVATLDDDGNHQVAEAFRHRLRVGTVDAFQGREFDVVLLSCTRSSKARRADDLEVRRRYGHLLIENRLCVAMSRAKRLLVSVGDLAMFEHGPVPGLARFAQLCRGEHGSVR